MGFLVITKFGLVSCLWGIAQLESVLSHSPSALDYLPGSCCCLCIFHMPSDCMLSTCLILCHCVSLLAHLFSHLSPVLLLGDLTAINLFGETRY